MTKPEHSAVLFKKSLGKAEHHGERARLRTEFEAVEASGCPVAQAILRHERPLRVAELFREPVIVDCCFSRISSCRFWRAIR